MNARSLPLFALLVGCPPPPSSSPSKAVVELYRHPNGLSNCVEEDGEKWKADPSCCPAGFTVAGFSVPAVTAFVEPTGEDGARKIDRKIYRHVVCMEGGGGGAK